MQEQIWKYIAGMSISDFFITAEIHRSGRGLPLELGIFIQRKLKSIQEGGRSSRFVFQEGEWRIYLTFFPTDRVVDERYALKNKVVSRGYK